MIAFDLTKEIGTPITVENGSMGGEVINLQTEFSVITEYFYKLMVGSGDFNKEVFYDIICESVERAEKLGIGKQRVIVSERKKKNKIKKKTKKN